MLGGADQIMCHEISIQMIFDDSFHSARKYASKTDWPIILYNGQTFACFQSDGTKPSSKLLLKRILRGKRDG